MICFQIMPSPPVAATQKVKWVVYFCFGIASQQHNEDIRQILGKILETNSSN